MAAKNMRSIRLSDELLELIDRQAGNNFTQKIENMITRCAWELPRKEEEIKRLDAQIEQKRNELATLMSRSAKLINTLSRLERDMQKLDTHMAAAVFEWDEKA